MCSVRVIIVLYSKFFLFLPCPSVATLLQALNQCSHIAREKKSKLKTSKGGRRNRKMALNSRFEDNDRSEQAFQNIFEMECIPKYSKFEHYIQ